MSGELRDAIAAAIDGHFTDAFLTQTVQFKDKVRNFAEFFIVRHKIKPQSLGHGPFNLFNTNLPRGTIGDCLGDTIIFTTTTVRKQ